MLAQTSTQRTMPPSPIELFCAPDIANLEFRYAQDQEIYGEGEEAEYVYQVVRGAVRTYKVLDDGRRHIGAFHLRGEVFGLEPGSDHRLTAEAVVETTVRLVRRGAVDGAARTDVSLAHALWVMTARDLGRAEEHMLLLGRKTALERVGAFLLDMDARLAAAGMLDLPMSRRDIADYLGLTLETVSRCISQLQDDGVLSRTGARQISLRRPQALRSMNA